MDAFLTQTFHDALIKLAIYVAPDAGDAIHKNRPSHGFAYICEGIKVYHFENGKTYTARANDIIYLPKNSNYMVEYKEDGGVYAINFDTTEEIVIPEFMHTVKNPSGFLKSYQNAEKIWTAKSIGYYEKTMQELYNILFLLKQEINAEYLPEAKVTLLAPALEYINAYYPYENISIPYLAGLCRIGEVYFRKIFKNIYGISPLKYIKRLKLVRAKELILSGEYSIQESAALAGFFDDSYFSREFKKEFGVSPKSLLKRKPQTD